MGEKAMRARGRSEEWYRSRRERLEELRTLVDELVAECADSSVYGRRRGAALRTLRAAADEAAGYVLDAMIANPDADDVLALAAEADDLADLRDAAARELRGLPWAAVVDHAWARRWAIDRDDLLEAAA